jgi:hypothetical protein
MGADGDSAAEGVEFLHVKKTTNGGVVLMLKTMEAAAWLRHPGIIGKFAKRMGGTATASATLCMVVAEYVPISYSPEGYKANGQVEEDSGLKR